MKQSHIYSYTDIELANIANIEQKLKNVLAKNAEAGKVVEGITKSEATELINWVVQRDRAILNQGSIRYGETIKTDSLHGLCGLSQGIVTTLFNNMGLQARVSNVNPTITGEGLGGIHSFSTLSIPIKDKNDTASEVNWLIDATLENSICKIC